MNRLRANLMVMVAVLVLATGFAFGLLVPGTKDLKKRRAEIGARLDEVRTEQETLGNMTELSVAIVNLEKQMRDFREKLPEERQFGEFLAAVSRAFENAGVRDYRVEPMPEMGLDKSRLPKSLSAARDTCILPVEVAFTGRFAQMVDALSALERLKRIFHVESLEVRNDEASPGRVKVRCILHTYHREEGGA